MILDRETGRYWGTAAQLAAQLVITEAMVNNYRQRDGLTCRRVGRNVYSPLDEASTIERAKRLSKEETGKGRPRRLDATLVNAA